MIAGMLRIKNEARWIRAVVASMFPVCERVVILDDHSEDDTVEICRSFGERVRVVESPFTGIDESRDKNHLLSEVRKLDPEWCLAIDGDEILEPAADRKISAAIGSKGCWRRKAVWKISISP